MSRIFSVLAIVSLTLIAVNLVLGLTISDWHAEAERVLAANQRVDELRRERRSEQDAELKAARDTISQLSEETRPLRKRVLFHMLLGIGAAIMAVLVNSISFTYFVGTNRWCKEVVDTYRLNTNYISQSNALKRHTFPWAVTGMLTVVVLVALGGAADPANRLAHPEAWANYHLLGAFVGLALITLSFWFQFTNILANFSLINAVMAEVKSIRSARGLETVNE